MSQILEGCPRLCVLVTSRARLGVRGEREFRVLPLALPDLGQDGASDVDAVSLVTQSGAGRLFVDRAREARWLIGALEGLAGLAAAQNDAERCLRLAGAAAAFREAIGEPCPPDRLARLARRLASARQMVAAKVATVAWAVQHSPPPTSCDVDPHSRADRHSRQRDTSSS